MFELLRRSRISNGNRTSYDRTANAPNTAAHSSEHTPDGHLSYQFSCIPVVGTGIFDNIRTGGGRDANSHSNCNRCSDPTCD